MVFYHALSNGFYLDEIYGTRTVFIPDPEWVRPTVSVPDPAWHPADNPPGAEAPLIDVSDAVAEAPLVEIANPNCRLPPAGELVSLTDQEYRGLLYAMSHGKVISANDNGYPVAVDPPPLSTGELEERERRWRDRALSATDALVVRHRDELEAGVETTLTTAQYRELQAYRTALRNWPATDEFPATGQRPTPPVWLTGTTS